MEVSDDGAGLQLAQLPEDQRSQYIKDRLNCEKQAGEAPNSQPLSEDAIRAVYHHYVDSRECLADLGYETSEPPSETVFVESYLQSYSNSIGPWSPFAEIRPTQPGEWETLLAACPQDPPQR